MGKKHPPFQDDITLVLQTQKTVIHKNVRINVAIQAQINPDQSEVDFRKQVHSTLREFIKGEWKIQSIHRQKGNQFEAVTVRATVRVSEKEDHQLQARASGISKIGFELVAPHSEYELTFDEIQTVNAELRLTLIKKALEECHQFNDAFTDAAYDETYYRISSTRFDSGNAMNAANNRGVPYSAQLGTSTASPMVANNAQVYQTEMMGDEESADDGSTDMGVSTRFSMVGTFILRSVHE